MKGTEQEKWMRLALRQAKKAEKADEVPIGAVIVKDGKLLATGYNRRQTKKDATLHAEIIAIRKACQKLQTWHLDDCELYVTLEPCCMCAGACINARIKKIVFGAYDHRFGCTGTLYNLPEDMRFNHRCETEGGVLQTECAEVLSAFFRKKREEKKAAANATNGMSPATVETDSSKN